MRWVVFLSIITTLVTASTWLVLRSNLPPRWVSQRKRMAAATLGFVAFCMLLEVAARRWAPAGGGAWRVPIALTRTSMFGTVGVAIALTLRNIALGLYRVARRLFTRKTAEPAAPDAPNALERREFLLRASALTVTGTSAIVLAYGGLKVARDLQVREHEVYIPGLPSALEGFTLVHLTDTHVGIFTGERDFAAVVERANALRGDAMVLTGDLVDNNPDHVPEAMRLFAKLRAKYGRFAVLGNHDYYAGYKEVLRGLEQTGIRPLVNDGVWIEGAHRDQGFALLGLEEVTAVRFGRRPDLARAIMRVNHEGPRVLLAHNPITFNSTAGMVDLQLSGHTHGGQVNPGSLLDLAMPYLSGRFDRDGSTLYVSNGLGLTGPPVRLGRPPEILRIALTGRART